MEERSTSYSIIHIRYESLASICNKFICGCSNDTKVISLIQAHVVKLSLSKLLNCTLFSNY